MDREYARRRSRGRDVEVRCSDCAVRHHCLADHLGDSDREWLERSLERYGPLQPGDVIFRADEPLENLAAVFSGTMKSTWLEPDGREHVAAFHLPGDIVGMDALHDGRHRWDVVAVDTVYICVFDYERIQDIAHHVAGIRRQVMRLLSRELGELGKLSSGPAARRLAAFLCEWSSRLKLRERSGRHFILPMTRRELASHLNLSPESVSRAFRSLLDRGMLEVQDHEVRILDHEGLSRV